MVDLYKLGFTNSISSCCQPNWSFLLLLFHSLTSSNDITGRWRQYRK